MTEETSDITFMVLQFYFLLPSKGLHRKPRQYIVIPINTSLLNTTRLTTANSLKDQPCKSLIYIYICVPHR